MKLPKFKLAEIKLPKIKLSIRIFIYTVTVMVSVLSILVACLSITSIIIASIIYVVAACMLGLSAGYLYQDIRYGVNVKIRTGIEGNSFTNRMVKDYRYRTVSFTYSSLSANLIFAVSNGIFGVIDHSVWFGTMAAYYIVLSIMRFIVIQYDRKISKIEKTKKMKKQELSVYQICGFLFILLTIALGVSVIQMVYFDQGHTYPGTLIFAVATYTFYKIVVALRNVVKAGRLKSPLLMTIRDIGYADAMVSMLSLQTAMFISFCTKDDTLTPQIMNSLTGGVICLIILIMGIYMMFSAARQKQLL